MPPRVEPDLPLAEVLPGFLAALGHPPALAEELAAGGEASPESVAEGLETAGLPVQLVALRSAGQRPEGAALVRRENGGWSVWRPGGEAPPQGVAILPAPSLEPGSSLADLAGAALRTEGPLLGRIALASLGLVAASLLPPLLIFQVLDAGLSGAAGSALSLLAMGALAAAGFQAWSGFVRGQLSLALEARLDLAVSRSYLGRLLGLPFPFLHRKPAGEVMQSYYALESFRQLLTETAPGAVLSAISALVYLVVASQVAPEGLGLVLLLAGGLALAAGWWAAGVRRRLRAREIAARARENGLLLGLISGIATLKAGGAERRAGELWRERLREEMECGLERARLAALATGARQMVQTGVPLLGLGWGAAATLRGDLSVGGLLTLSALTSGYVASLARLGEAGDRFAESWPERERIREVLLQGDGVRRRTRASSAGPVVLQGVWFRYADDGPWILRDYALRVEPGAKVRLLGPSGAGKTTVLRLIAGLWAPQRGSVRIAGADPAVPGGPGLLYLPQLVRLSGSTLLESLRVLSGQASRGKILAAAEETGLATWIRTLPMGLETPLPPGAGNLSGGQRQLLALTAAAAADARLVLLDEPMSNLDTASRQRVLAASGLSTKTVIYASHDEIADPAWAEEGRVSRVGSAVHGGEAPEVFLP